MRLWFNRGEEGWLCLRGSWKENMMDEACY